MLQQRTKTVAYGCCYLIVVPRQEGLLQARLRGPRPSLGTGTHRHRSIHAQVHTHSGAQCRHKPGRTYWEGVMTEPWFHVIRTLSPTNSMILERVLNHSGPLFPFSTQGM